MVWSACSAACDAVARTSLAVNRFAREVPESRLEFDAISSELHLLNGVLGLLRDAAARLPTPLAEHTPAVLDTCLSLLGELEGCVSVLNRPGLSRADKRSRWLASREQVDKLRWTLEEYKLTLGLAVDLVDIALSQTSFEGRHAISHGSPRLCDNSLTDHEVETVACRILDTVSDLETRLPQNAALVRLEGYLLVLATLAADAREHAAFGLRASHRDGCSSVGEAPDSAIDVSYEDPVAPPPRSMKRKLSLPPSDGMFGTREEGVHELVGELEGLSAGPCPPPTPPPPPRSASRLASTIRAPVPRLRTTNGCSSSDDTTAIESPCSPDCPSSPAAASHLSARYSYCTPVTELPERTAPSSGRPDKRASSGRRSVLGRVLPSPWEIPRSEVPSPVHLTTSSGDGHARTPRRQSGLLRRGSLKLSTTFRSLALRQPPRIPKTVEDHGEQDGAIFGVPLAASMQVAKGIASTRHDSSSDRATREYPLAVLRCVYHVLDRGLDAPHIFGVDGDQLRVAQLTEVFSSPETGYGKELDWARFTVYDAADVVLLFLSSLPEPLVPVSIGKRWISLSRQATTGSARLDQGLDFWEEALMGIRGPARALFKLLLNLWGDVADAAEANEMTAERLAGRVLRPLMHAPAAARHTDFMLGLAFLIRKRSEYNLAARGVARKSNAAF